MPEQGKKKKTWLWILLAVLALILIIVVVWFVFFRSTPTESTNQQAGTDSQNTNKTVTLYPCESSPSGQIQTIPGFTTQMMVAAKDEHDNFSETPSTSSSLSIASYADGKETEDLYYHVMTSDGSFMPGGVIGFEVCDKDGKKEYSYSFKDNEPASENTTGMWYYIGGGYVPTTPGTYTVYGWFKAPNSDKWVLTNKQDVTFTK